MEDRRNIILAVLLTGLILFGWPYIAEQFFPAPPPAEKTAAAPAKTGGASTDGGDIATSSATAKAVALPAALAANPRVLIETPKLSGSINLEGARVDDLVLTTHRQELSKKSPPVRLFAPSGTENAYFARFGWTGNGATLPTDNASPSRSASRRADSFGGARSASRSRSSTAIDGRLSGSRAMPRVACVN